MELLAHTTKELVIQDVRRTHTDEDFCTFIFNRSSLSCLNIAVGPNRDHYRFHF